MSEGKKFDQGKIQPSIVLGDFSRALTEVCIVGEFGIQKYSAGNWLLVEDAKKRYEDALLRHWLESKNVKIDHDSKRLHIAHVTWNALAVLELELREQDRLDFTEQNGDKSIWAEINKIFGKQSVFSMPAQRSASEDLLGR